MPADSLRHSTRRANLNALLKAPGMGPTALAEALGKPKLRAHISNLAEGKRGIGDQLAKAIEDALELGAGWMDRQHPVAGEALGAPGVAQLLSDPLHSHELPLLTWEFIVQSPVPPIFRAVLPDDALAPDFPAGTEIVWTTRRRASPGRLVLVRDRHGQVHARQCHQGRSPGHWIAAAVSPAYVSFDSTDEGFELIAVYKGRLEPDD